MKQFSLIAFFLLAVFSCTRLDNGSSSAAEDEATVDSAQLRIAVLPTLDCLPLFLAEERGYFEAAGVDVGLQFYQAQMDQDTAFMHGTANAVVTDLIRVQRMQQLNIGLQLVTSTDASWQLLSKYSARIKEPEQLDDKMIAMTRFSATHLLSDLTVDSAKLKPERVFRIQVNDIGVRLSMLQTGIMDALLLPEPQATVARNIQARVLLDTRKLDLRFGVIAFSSQAATTHNVNAFKKAYDMACDTINHNGLAAYSALIMRYCGVSQHTIDSLPDNYLYTHAADPRPSDVSKAAEWMKKQKTAYVDER